MTAPTPGWRALPECPVCGIPVRRATFDANGGTCTDCRAVVEYMDPGTGQVSLLEWQRLAADRGRADREAAARRKANRGRRR